MSEIAVSKLKATCLSVVDEVRKTRKSILITKFGEPVAQIVPLPLADLPKHWLGSFAGTGTIVGDIVGPIVDESEWKALKD
jgi:prevent-host-death family protein